MSSACSARCRRRSPHRGELAQKLAYFVLMKRGNPGQQPFPLRQQMDFHHPLVITARAAPEELPSFAAIDQCDDPVVMRLKAFGQFADAGPGSARGAQHVQQQLVLQRCQPVLLAQEFAHAQKVPQAVAKVGQAFVVLFDELRRRRGGQC
jgi:hypothetical protein